MKLRVLTLAGLLALGASAGCDKKSEEAKRDEPGTSAAEKPREPDNTGVNERDRSDKTVTVVDQKENEKDLEITQQIRKAVIADDSLSTKADNVKIITADAVVTLRGPVENAAEKASIEKKARAVAGVTRVVNLLEVDADEDDDEAKDKADESKGKAR
jgi:hyperosmotically inducible periplasmic protein